MAKPTPEELPDPGFLQIVWSIIASFCGIQTGRNLDKDDAYIEKTGFMPYIIVGVVMTFLFVLAIYSMVQIILHYAAS